MELCLVNIKKIKKFILSSNEDTKTNKASAGGFEIERINFERWVVFDDWDIKNLDSMIYKPKNK